jgi:hypothetical protein
MLLRIWIKCLDMQELGMVGARLSRWSSGSGRDQQANERVFRACIHAQIVISPTVILDFAMAAALFESTF